MALLQTSTGDVTVVLKPLRGANHVSVKQCELAFEALANDAIDVFAKIDQLCK